MIRFRLCRILGWVAYLLVVLAVPSVAQTPPELPTRLPDIAYADAHERQTLTLYLPEVREKPLPVLFMVHGGGYVFGDNSILRPAAEMLADEGYAVVTPNYRLAPAFPYPAPVKDIFCAYAWTVAHVDRYGFDSSQIIPAGESAGANAAALIGTVDDPTTFLDDCDYSLPDDHLIPGVVAYYMPVELSTCACQFAKRLGAAYLGVDATRWEEANQLRDVWEEASPLAWIDSDDPPFLLIHGTDDRTVPISESEYFRDEYEAVGGEVTFVTVEDAGHGFVGNMTTRRGFEDTLPDVLDFLARVRETAPDAAAIAPGTD